MKSSEIKFLLHSSKKMWWILLEFEPQIFKDNPEFWTLPCLREPWIVLDISTVWCPVSRTETSCLSLVWNLWSLHLRPGLQEGVEGDRSSSLVPNRSSSFPCLRTLLYGDNFSARAALSLPPHRAAIQGPCSALPSSWRALDPTRVVISLQCQPCEKRPLYIWYKASAGLIHSARNMLSSGRRAAKWHFNTNSLSCLPTTRLSQAGRNTQWLVFSTPCLPRCQVMLFWGTVREKPYSLRSSSPAKKSQPAGAWRGRGDARKHQNIHAGWEVSSSVPSPNLGRSIWGPGSHEQHLSAQASNPSSGPQRHVNAGASMTRASLRAWFLLWQSPASLNHWVWSSRNKWSWETDGIAQSTLFTDGKIQVEVGKGSWSVSSGLGVLNLSCS